MKDLSSLHCVSLVSPRFFELAQINLIAWVAAGCNHPYQFLNKVDRLTSALMVMGGSSHCQHYIS
jgi:hypothetical protein